MDLKNRTAVITGGNRGLGKAIARAMAEAGAKVVIAARDKAVLETAAREIGNGCDHVVCDVTDAAAIDALAGAIAADILVNNAGINIRKPLDEFPLEEWRRVIEVNLFGVMLCCKAFVPGMKQRGYGRILNLGSTMASVALANRTAYCASKAGVVAMTRALALELAPLGVTVNTISPGPFATEMNTPLLQDPVRNAEFISKIPVGRWGRVEEIGSLAVFLASEAAGFITGADILIDGGWTAQ